MAEDSKRSGSAKPEGGDAAPGVTLADGSACHQLPPIGHVVEPKMQHMSTRIRWFAALGYSTKEIAGRTGARYQQVRNVRTTEPKRAAREDLPSLVISLLELETDLEAMEHQALIENMSAQRAQARKAPVKEEDLDNEDYGRSSAA